MRAPVAAVVAAVVVAMTRLRLCAAKLAAARKQHERQFGFMSATKNVARHSRFARASFCHILTSAALIFAQLIWPTD